VNSASASSMTRCSTLVKSSRWSVFVTLPGAGHRHTDRGAYGTGRCIPRPLGCTSRQGGGVVKSWGKVTDQQLGRAYPGLKASLSPCTEQVNGICSENGDYRA